jgi:hypothetical protein
VLPRALPFDFQNAVCGFVETNPRSHVVIIVLDLHSIHQETKRRTGIDAYYKTTTVE